MEESRMWSVLVSLLVFTPGQSGRNDDYRSTRSGALRVKRFPETIAALFIGQSLIFLTYQHAMPTDCKNSQEELTRHQDSFGPKYQ